MEALELLTAAYQPLCKLSGDISDDQGWLPTALPGWTVRDLLFHLASDAQRALVAFGTPADGPPDTDEISYWTAWKPGTDGAAAGLRGTRIIASAWTSVRSIAELFADTARATLELAARVHAQSVVQTQHRRLTVDSLLRTLAVEAGVHHLDMGGLMPGNPASVVLAEVRRTLDGLLGEAVPLAWDDVRYIRVGTGRADLTEDERHKLGALADRFPLFG